MDRPGGGREVLHRDRAAEVPRRADHAGWPWRGRRRGRCGRLQRRLLVGPAGAAEFGAARGFLRRPGRRDPVLGRTYREAVSAGQVSPSRFASVLARTGTVKPPNGIEVLASRCMVSLVKT